MSRQTNPRPIEKPFPRYLTRNVTGLNGIWDFAFLGDVDPASTDVRRITFNHRLPVPSCFDAFPDFAGFVGVGAYRTSFDLPSDSPGILEFEGVGFRCDVYVNGQRAGGIRHGWTPFSVDIPKSLDGHHELILLTDNRFDYAASPLHEPFFDFHHWGGITRSVWLHAVPATHIRYVQVAAEPGQPLEVQVELSTPSTDPLEFAINHSPCAPDGLAWISETSAVASFTHSELAPWTPETPNLHLLRVSMPDDDTVVRFGVRKISATDGKILLNGDPLRLFGVNRHESHPQFGAALPTAQLAADLQLIRSIGGNFVRGSHYPQDQRFLDLCDEAGVLVWEEGIGWGQRERQLTDPSFQAEHSAMLRAMIRRSSNHPSVILWGFLNEAGTNHPSARAIIEESVKLFRETDPTRLVTYATMFPTDDLFYDLIDVISVNTYPGWYGCEDHSDPLGLILPRLNGILAHLEESGFGKTPFILSEIGVEAIPGWHDPFNGFFTEEFQAEYLSTVIREFLANPRYSGLALWHFADARTYRGGRSLMRPRAFNNKGLFDEYRRPKRAVETIQRLLAAKP